MRIVRDGTPIMQVAKQMGIAESGLRRWLERDDVDAGRKPGLTTVDTGICSWSPALSASNRSRDYGRSLPRLCVAGDRATLHPIADFRAAAPATC